MNRVALPVSAAPVLLLPVAAGVIGLAAVYSPKLALVGLAAVFLAVLMLTRLTLGLAFFTIVTFFNLLPSGRALDIAKPIGIVLTFSWAMMLLRRGREAPLLTRDHPVLTYLLFAFFGWAAMSIAWAQDTSSARSSVVRLALSIVFLLIVHSTVQTPRDLHLLAWSFVVGTALSAAYGFVFGLDELGRFVGGLGDPNFMGSVLVASMALCGFMLAATRSVFLRLLLMAFGTLDAVALVPTQSRGSLVALAAVLVAACILAGRHRPQAIAVSVVVVALGVGYYAAFAPAALRQRATNFSAEGSTGRTDIWGIAWHIVQDHPLEGVGLDNFRVVESQHLADSFNILNVQRLRRLALVTHDTYLQILTELGVVGLVLLLGVIGGAVDAAVRGIRILSETGDRATEAVARGMLTGVIGLLAAYVFVSGQYSKQLWLVLGLLIALPTVARSASGPPSGTRGHQ